MTKSSIPRLLCSALLCCLRAAPSWSADAPPAPRAEHVTVHGAAWFGRDIEMLTDVWQPSGPGPFPVVLFSHGRASQASERARLAQPLSPDQIAYWLGHGFAVVAPIRPGYGATGGPDAENSGARFDANGNCISHPDFRITADAATRSVEATLAWLRGQAWADSTRVVLVGQSVGGLTTVAEAAHRPPGVVAYVNFAGGTGGEPKRAPGRSCEPQQLTTLYTEYGKTTIIPNLWVYAQNDQYWGPQVPVEWHAGFSAGGSRTSFVHAPPVADGDGHGLSRHDAALWAPYVDAFLASIGWSGARH